MAFRVFLAVLLVCKLALARLLDVDLDNANFYPAKTHRTSACNTQVTVFNSYSASLYKMYTTNKPNTGDELSCNTYFGHSFVSRRFNEGKPEPGVLNYTVASGLNDNQVRHVPMSCTIYKRFVAPPHNGSVVMSSPEPSAAPMMDVSATVRTRLVLETTPEPFVNETVALSPIPTTNYSFPPPPPRFNSTVVVFAPDADGVEFNGVVTDSGLNYLVVNMPDEVCVWSGAKPTRFDVTGKYQLLKSDIELLAPAPFCKETLELKPTDGTLDASGMLFDGATVPCLNGSFDLVEPSVFPSYFKQYQIYNTSRRYIPHFGATIKKPMMCNGSAVYVGAAELSLDANIFNFVTVKNASIFGLVTSATPQDPDSYKVCIYSANVTTKGLMTLLQSSHSVATNFWAVAGSVIAVIVALSLAVIVLLALRYRRNKNEMYQATELGGESIQHM